jgi:hypothetical protein
MIKNSVILIQAIILTNLGCFLAFSADTPIYLSDIVSSQIYRIDQQIKYLERNMKALDLIKQQICQYRYAARMQFLHDRKNKVINTWKSGDLTQITAILPDDLKTYLDGAKVDLATPVLDTRV